MTFEWGVHLLRPAELADVRAAMRNGVCRFTVHLPWRWVGGLDAGPRNWAPLEHFLAPLQAAGAEVQGILGPGMPHLLPQAVVDAGGPDDSEYARRFSEYCADAAAKFPWIRVFRVEDELNAAAGYERVVTRRRRGEAWRSSEYRLRLLRLAVDAVRGARPDAEIRVVVNASLPGWRSALRRWLAGGIVVDRLGLALRPCFILPDPALSARVSEALDEAREVLASGPWSRGAPALEVARIGYPTHRRLFSPRNQREFLVAAGREAVRGGAVGMHWFSMRDQAHPDPILGYWPPAQERHFGLQYYDGVPKPAFDEFRVLSTGDRFGEGG